MVYLFLKDGFEEAEALVTADVLRRAGAEVALVGDGEVRGSHGIRVAADMPTADVNLGNADMLILPGGLAGVRNLKADETVLTLLRGAAERGIRIAAICAAPSVLGELGLLRGKFATCYPGFETALEGAVCPGAGVITDGLITTGKAAGTVYPFAYELARILCGEAAADKVRAGMYAGEDAPVIRR
ncbi:MAG: DJ-1 family glyoxalase III [Clostridiaceae bacterium]|nr:DJ-1 family glyoxalase III [Clostridiaceae bacterium]